MTAATTEAFLRALGVPDLPARTSPFDPGYDPVTVESHLSQSARLISMLKLSMACWIVAEESATRKKLAAARSHGVRTVTGGGPFEVAVAQQRLPQYLDLCAELGFARIEAGQGFTEMPLEPECVVAMASERGLEVQFELGKKHDGAFTELGVRALIDQGRRWVEAGALQLVVEARESAAGVGLFDAQGGLDPRLADSFVEAFGIDAVVFEAPTKPSQFALLDYFGPQVHLSNVRLEELLRVEIYRRGLHSDAFSNPNLRPPPGPAE
jgi:phosphosulfolactate synthase